jgi:DNA-binding response OmpR family regulator
VQNRRGHIEIDSEPGTGTTIRILLPVTRLNQPRAVTDQGDEVPSGRGEHVLLVEDEEAVRSATSRLLERRGYVVSAVPDGDSALRAAANEEFDLVLTDVLLPGGTNGREVAESLRRDHPGLAVVYMTGHSRDILEGVGLDLEELILIRKPFEEDRLLAMVRTAIDRTEGPHRGSPETVEEDQANSGQKAEGDMTSGAGDETTAGVSTTTDAPDDETAGSSNESTDENESPDENESTDETESVVESLR